ncbi:MAG: DNA helicase RecQ [Butyrivibrio sp.]|nr:DNA helicase RecQ [Butyrivibrio sp.]
MNKFEALKSIFGYDSFREGQEKIIDDILSGRDVLGIMPTGAGKSLCYQVPALVFKGITIVVSPLISLMKDQVRGLNEAGVHAAFINSSLTEGQINKALLLASKGQYKIIYVAPERLDTYSFINFAKAADISQVTVDEAHCISQWGQDFRPGYLRIEKFISLLPKRPVVSAFTATATKKVRDDILNSLKLKDPAIMVTGFDRDNLYFGVETPARKTDFVFDYVKKHAGQSGIIYCATRKNVDQLYLFLLKQGIDVLRYHAGLSGEERKQNQEEFIYDNKSVIVATNAFGMGIDKSNVRYVIHYNMPQSLENYYQEAGRAGRDMEEAECILLYSGQDVMINKFLLESKEENTDLEPAEILSLRIKDEEKLKAMTNYCTTHDCLRRYILDYFGDDSDCSCDKCSNCRAEFEQEDITTYAQAVISCVLEINGRYGAAVVAGILSGSGASKIKNIALGTLQSYGSLSNLSEGAIREIIAELILQQILTTSPDRYSLLRTGEMADAVLIGEKTVILKRKIKKSEESKRIRPSGINKKKGNVILNSKGDELFEKLRFLRKIIAADEKVPPYIVFSDKTLVDMCARLPFDKEQMLRVSGVGDNKYDRYGERFIEVIREYTKGEKIQTVIEE